MRRYVLTILTVLLPLLVVNAQDKEDPSKYTYRSFLIGIGNLSSYDTYLSPLKYTGNNLSLFFEQRKMTGLADSRIASQHLINLELAKTKNPSGNVTGYTGHLEYGYAMHYHYQPVSQINLFAGIQAHALAGFNYNNRNGNNPATPKVNVNLALSGIAQYRFLINNLPVRLRYQLNLPFAGTMYAMAFGQSYYEMDMAGYKDIFHFASFHNQIIVRNMLTLELPFSSAYIFRLSYLNNFYETRINQLDTRIVSNSLLIGLSYNFQTVSTRKDSYPGFNQFN